MKLITKELEQLFSKYPFHSQENRGGDARVLVKYFNPTGVGTWYITEAEKKSNGKYEFFGYCHLGDDMLAELGYVNQEKLENIKLPFGLTIERDLYIPKDIKLRDAIRGDGLEVPSHMLRKNSKEREER